MISPYIQQIEENLKLRAREEKLDEEEEILEIVEKAVALAVKNNESLWFLIGYLQVKIPALRLPKAPITKEETRNIEF